MAQETWRLTLSDVQVVRQREGSGDRPYFVMIQFRSRFGVRGSTQVNVVSHEPHDWVSKPFLRGALPSGADHLFRGERATLPFWMRDLDWRSLSPLPSPLVDNQILWERVAAALNTEVAGAVIVGLDNNNTPPHVIRALADSIGGVLAQTLREDVESSTAFVALSNDFRSNLERKLSALASRVIGVDRVIDLAGQLTFGSTFNPDQLTGIQVLIMPALVPFRTEIEDSTLNLPTILTAGPVDTRSVIRALQPWSETLTFRGSGAVYAVRANLAMVGCPEADLLRSLNLSMLSGDDGLRGDSRLQLELDVAGRGPIILPLGGGDGDRRFNVITRSVTLPTAVSRRDLLRLGIRFPSSSTFQDNWTLNALQVRGNGATLLSASGRPLMRFTGESRRFMTDISCANPSATPPVDPAVSQLEVTIRTGADDLRGGNDNAFIFAILRDRSRIEAPFNDRARLADRSSRTAILTLPPGISMSQIQRFGVRATLGGGLGGDNWNIDALTVRAMSSRGAQTILEQSGAPLVRLTGDRREQIWDLRR